MLRILSDADIYIAPSDRDAFLDLRQQLFQDVQPMNALQTELFNTLLRAAWNLRRCDAAERHLAQLLGCDPLLSTDRRIDRIRLERKENNREYRQALAQLRKLQTDQAIRQFPAHEGLRVLPAPVDTPTLIRVARQAAGYRPNQPIAFAALPNAPSTRTAASANRSSAPPPPPPPATDYASAARDTSHKV